jgi:hydrogen peroxide-dependent heme synthase
VAEFPPVPLTVEGASALHQMFRFRWRNWLNLDSFRRQRILGEATALLAPLEVGSPEGHPNQSAVYSQLGHKGDLMLVHFRDSFEELNQTEISLAKLELADFLEPVHSYLSVVELGLYESTSKSYQALAEKGFATHSPEWKAGIAEVTERQKAAMAPRLYPRIPESKYLCFYPMDRRRGEEKNWYLVPMAERQRMMHEHGLIGRRYADEVRQVITGSIGFDDWEWGVDLFAEDPLVFKKLIYEMRFDEVSAIYALFGAFYVGLRVKVADLGQLLSGPPGS